MKYDQLRQELLVFKEGKHMLGKFLNEYIYYYNNEEKERFKESDDVYPLTIKWYNEHDPEKKAELDRQIKFSLTYCTFRSLCRKYEEADK